MHAPLFTAPVLLVEQPRQLFASEGHYEVLSEAGEPLAYVNEHMTTWPRSHRQGSHRPHRFTIYGPDGYPLMSLDKPWDRGRPYIYVTGPHGEPYGSIVQDRSFMGSRFRLNDPRGHTIAEIRGDWNGWDFSIKDHAGIEIARISKEHPGLTGGFFTTDDRYALEFAYDLPWPLRRLVIGAAITIDVLLHERDPEFYHSHYADFRRYPEYGYEPRHHWHHPRRGYVVSRRRRPPLVVHTFRSARTRDYVPMRERVTGPRGNYRTFSSRSGAAPARAARPSRPPRSERRSGGGFASRSETPPRRGGGFDSRSDAGGRGNRSARTSRSESPSSGSVSRRERQTRQGGGSQGGASDRSRSRFGGASGGSGSSGSSGGFGSRGSSSRSSGASSSRSSSSRFGGSSGSFGSSSRGSSGKSGSTGRGSGGFRRSGGGRSGGGRSGGGRSSGGRSGGRRSGGGRSRR
ncbi:LURP-one-related/scramblase family protein [Nocardiopsis nanhaiensis]